MFACVCEERREQLLEEAGRTLTRWPARSAPGPNGSWFEHWGTVGADSDALSHAIEVGQTIIEKQVGQTVTQVPSSASSRPSRLASVFNQNQEQVNVKKISLVGTGPKLGP